jgi:uncharacterized membrane protein
LQIGISVLLMVRGGIFHCGIIPFWVLPLSLAHSERNLALQPDLIALRTATTSAYTTAQHLQDRWKEVEAKQSGVYQVGLFFGHQVDGLDGSVGLALLGFVAGMDVGY